MQYYAIYFKPEITPGHKQSIQDVYEKDCSIKFESNKGIGIIKVFNFASVDVVDLIGDRLVMFNYDVIATQLENGQP